MYGFFQQNRKTDATYMISINHLSIKTMSRRIRARTVENSLANISGISMELYNNTINEVINICKSIDVAKVQSDGRIDSAIKEGPFLQQLEKQLLAKYPDWDVVISPPRAFCDVKINSIPINLKLTDCKTADNSVNKSAIYFSITGKTDYPYSSNWNDFWRLLKEAKAQNCIKTERHKPTEYHYLVKNKITGDVLLKPIFDIKTYISNPSNDLQIHWKNEFASISYETEDVDYHNKVQELLCCLQKSVREMIARTQKFAEADISELI